MAEQITETIEIKGLPQGTREALERIGHGKTVEEYARMVLEAKVLAEKPFSEILAPIRRSFKESGMSEHELDAIVERAREDFYHKTQLEDDE